MSRRDDAVALVRKIFTAKPAIHSRTDPETFRAYTGTSHDDLKKNWKGGGIMTACNGFTGWYAAQVGITTGPKAASIESWFALESSLQKAGRLDAWVPADGTSDPQPGDILHHRQSGTGLHVDVALGFAPGRKLIRAGAGQTSFGKKRNPEAETDILTIVTGQTAYDYNKLIGWLDLDRFFDNTPGASQPNVNWALGWWDINDGQQYYYYFAPNGTVQYTKARPVTLFAPPSSPVNSGRYHFTQHNALFIRWNAWDGDPTEETFTATGIRTTMQGTSNRYAPLTGKKIVERKK